MKLMIFTAPWCSHCKVLKRTMAGMDFAAAYPELETVEVNVDERGDLAEDYGIMSIPTLLLIDKDQVVARLTGERSKTIIDEFIRNHISTKEDEIYG